ncbi:MAG: hypothetical protein WC943_10760 [Elusimicrobiota bacterium]|jgi:hypothetical protein
MSIRAGARAAFLSLLVLAAVQAFGAAPEPCPAELYDLSRTAAPPGGEFSLYGRWGEERGASVPAINRGAGHDLEVLSWSDTNVRVQVPKGLQPGTYRVGVSCGKGNPYSSSYKDFEVLQPGQAAPVEKPEPEELHPPKEAPRALEDGWQEKFEAQWREKGMKAAEARTWLKGLRLFVLGDAGVSKSVLREAADSAIGGLREFGARRFSVEVADDPAPESLASCSKQGVLDRKCFHAGLAGLRADDAGYASAGILFVTDAALGELPRKLPDGSTLSPPAGEASDAGGWILLSEYFRRKRLGSKGDDAFARCGRDHTVRHELGHLLGLPHHQSLPNPGFAEPIPCTACRHRGAGWHKPPHPECLMVCGSADDDCSHRQTFGESFGPCRKCAAAGRALLAGIEEAAER